MPLSASAAAQREVDLRDADDAAGGRRGDDERDGATSSARVTCEDCSSSELASYAGAARVRPLMPRNMVSRGWSTVWVPLRVEQRRAGMVMGRHRHDRATVPANMAYIPAAAVQVWVTAVSR